MHEILTNLNNFRLQGARTSHQQHGLELLRQPAAVLRQCATARHRG